MKSTPWHRPALTATASLAAALLYGCGGGGGTDTPAAPPAPAPAPAPVVTTTQVATRVIDGPIRNALVCLDVNANSACDANEPSARTNAAGDAALTVPNADVGKYSVIAVVGTDAVDVDFGAVTVPFVMKAPADKTAVVSPLTTLVQAHASSTATTTEQAEAFVKAQTGLSGSLLADYTAATDSAATAARLLARLAVITTQQQTTALAGVVGQRDLSGSTITTADVQNAIATSLLDVLPALGAAVTDPSVTDAADKDAALRATATDIVTTQSALTPATAVATIGVARLVATATNAAPATPSANVSMRAFTWTDAGNWFWRGLASTADDATPDANNRVRFYDRRTSNANGVTQVWGNGTTYARRGDLHWSGDAWVDCPYGERSTLTVRDVSGVANFDYCRGLNVGTTRSSPVDISGRTLASVWSEIRAFPGSDSGVAYADWGPPTAAPLGGAVFPAGSVLSYHKSTSLSNALAYDPLASNIVIQFSAAVAAGANVVGGGTGACASIGPGTPLATYSAPAQTLDGLIAVNRGTPCIFGVATDANGSSVENNAWWSQSTLNLGTVAGAAVRPAGSGNFFTTTQDIRVAFGEANTVKYYNCLIRTSGGTGRNCKPAGTGTYSITTLGDAKVLRFTSSPASAAKLSSDRIFVERGGNVYFGYLSKATTTDSIRLNLVATNAVFGQLGMPAFVP
jgi:hypothetical protein